MSSIKRYIPIFLIILCFGAFSCKKSYLDRMPSDQIPLEEAFKTTSGLRAALNGIHRTMYETVDDDQFGQKSIDLMSDMMCDDMPIAAAGAGWFLGAYRFQDHRTASGTAGYAWTFYYRIISNVNQILVHLDAADGPQSEKDNIKGQALTYRAFAYYYLASFYMFNYAFVNPNEAPCVPIYTEPTRTGNPRATVEQVYDFIESDLTTAIELLGNGGPRQDKSQIDGSVAHGLMARVALNKQDWASAASYARAARQGYSFMDTVALKEGFNNMQNVEWMWGSTLNVDQTSNTRSFLSHVVYESGGYAALGQQKLVNSSLYNSLNNADVRKRWWYGIGQTIGTPYRIYSQRKFKVKVAGTFITDVCYMRSAEMALIEAEAEANMNNIAGAADILNQLIRTRYPEYAAPTDSKRSLILEILRQRRIELWGEGFRFLDIMRQMAYDETILAEGEKGLVRNNQYDESLAVTTSVPSGSTQFLFRLPSSEIENNENISDFDQNP